MERRRAAADQFAWAVPAVVVASQAFILTIALDSEAEPWTRLIACAAGFVTLLGAWHQFTKQTFHFALYEAVIKRERRHLGLPLVDRDSLLAHADSLELRFQCEWLKQRNGELVSRTSGDAVFFAPKWPILVRARIVWPVIFFLVLVLDVGLGVWAILDWISDSSHGRQPRYP